VKAKLVWILAGLVILVAVASAAFLLSPYFPLVHELVLEKEKGLPKDKTISVKTKVEGFGVHKGDAFPYVVEVWYNPAQVSEIDKAGLADGVNLRPFEIRNKKEEEFDLDSKTRVYRRKHEIQFIEGKVGRLYRFPAIVVRYKPKDSERWSNMSVAPEPIFVAPRLPSDVSGLELRPIKGKIEDRSQKSLPWILVTLGGFLVALGVVDLAWRAIPQWKEMAKRRRKGQDLLSQAYRSLQENVAQAVDPKYLFHQMDHILRVVLARKEKGDWLEEPNLDLVSSGIRPSVISLSEQCQKAYNLGVIEQGKVEEALRQLEEILVFYYGKREVEAWKS